MKNKISPELLKKYLRGETSPEESNLIDKWYTSFDENNPDDFALLHGHKALEERILRRIRERIKPDQQEASKKNTRPFLGTTMRWAAAITLLAVVGLGMFLFNQSKSKSDVITAQSKVNGVKKITNNTASISRQMLSDGTVILLQPNSSIEFPSIFSQVKREVHLTGEAFFDVAKDKSWPFIITTGDVTVSVLGTSFNVKAYQEENEITVAVKTGRVLVTKSESSPDKIQEGEKEEIILTPNQEVVYSTLHENFLKKLVDEPAIILTKPTLFEMKYDGTPVVRIFEVLEENYGIDIVYDEKILAGCSLTTSMNEEGLYERIEIICKAIGAQYEITDSRIVINSNGCQ